MIPSAPENKAEDSRAYPEKLDGKETEMYNNVHYGERESGREKSMREVTFTEFRKNAASYFDSVERGETVRVSRHGKPVAEIVPLASPARVLSWKRPGILVDAGAASLSREVIQERKRASG